MSNLLISVFFLVNVTFFFSTTALAWDDVGHKLTGYIAWQQMTPEARERAIKILRSSPEDANLGVFFLQTARSDDANRLDFFMLATTWADIVRDRDFKVRFGKYHKGGWHYLDTFWKESAGKIEVLPDMESAKENAVERLYFFDKQLRNPAVSDADKAVALAWILHLGGDIHQPLHASGRVTDLEPKGDQGGNLFLLTPKDTPREKSENLHWFWDSIVKRSVIRKNDACDADYLPPIAQKIMKKYPLGKMLPRLNPGKFDAWQYESFQIAAMKLYPESLKRYEAPSKDYRKMAYTVAEEQIALAGYRLGALLNQIFGTNPVTAASADEPCRIIRRAHYPVTQTNPSGQPLEICLLNLCPPNKGMVQRPMYSMIANGRIIEREYDIDKVFKSEKEARDYAAQNGIKDVSF